MFGATEIVAFAKGMAQHTRVDIRVHSGQPSTDGNTVWLNTDPCLTKLEYEGKCGTSVHEVAHVWFKSVQTCKGWAKQIAQKHGADWAEFAAHECINVALDIFDETRMEKLLPQTARVMRSSNLLAGGRLYTQKAWENMPKWRWALLFGILNARLMKPGERYWLRTCWRRCLTWLRHQTRRMGFEEVTRTCVKCKEAGKVSCVLRKSRQWARVRAQAERLFELILPHVQPSDDQTMSTTKGVTGEPGTDPAKDVREEAIQHEHDIADQNGTGQNGNGRHAGKGQETTDGSKFDPAFYGQARQTLTKAVEVLMETQESMRLCRRDLTGDRLGRRWINVFTDQKVFENPDRHEAQELSLALLLDRSSSMCGIMGEAAACCKALGDVVEQGGGRVDCWLFSHVSEHRPLQKLSEGVLASGGTQGGDSVKAATKWLTGERSGRKMIIAITDGEWFDLNVAQYQVRRAGALGIEFVIIGLGMHYPTLQASWPGVPCVCCQADAGQLTETLIRTVGAVTV
jgi:hypothetical protein